MSSTQLPFNSHILHQCITFSGCDCEFTQAGIDPEVKPEFSWFDFEISRNFLLIFFSSVARSLPSLSWGWSLSDARCNWAKKGRLPPAPAESSSGLTQVSLSLSLSLVLFLSFCAHTNHCAYSLYTLGRALSSRKIHLAWNRNET